MPDISSLGPGPVGPADRPSSTSSHRNGAVAREIDRPPKRPDRPGDRVEVSEHARLLDQIRRMPPARYDHVERVREQIAEGTYETEEKLDAAIERLVDDLDD